MRYYRIGGEPVELSPTLVREECQRGRPGKVLRYAVRVGGIVFPPKQVMQMVVPRRLHRHVHSKNSRRILYDLGFPIFRLREIRP